MQRVVHTPDHGIARPVMWGGVGAGESQQATTPRHAVTRIVMTGGSLGVKGSQVQILSSRFEGDDIGDVRTCCPGSDRVSFAPDAVSGTSVTRGSLSGYLLEYAPSAVTSK